MSFERMNCPDCNKSTMGSCGNHFVEIGYRDGLPETANGVSLEGVKLPPEDMQTEPACEGHNWEIGQVRPEWDGGYATTSSANYREIALVICTFCGVVRKTLIKNL